MSRGGDAKIVVRVFRMATPYALPILAVFLLSLLSTPFALLTPIPLAWVVDHAIGDKAVPRVLAWTLGPSPNPVAVIIVSVVLTVAIAAGKHAASLVGGALKVATGQRMVLDFRRRLFRHAQRLSLLYHDSHGTADSIYRIQKDASAVQTIALDALAPLVTSAVTVVGMLVVAARIDATLAAIAFAVAPATVVLTQFYRRRVRREWRVVKGLESAAQTVVQEVLTSLRVVRAFGQEDYEEDRYTDIADQGLRSRVRANLAEQWFILLISLVSALGTAAVLYVGARAVLAGAISLGSLLLVMSYLSQIYGPLNSIGRRLTELQSALVGAERAFALLDRAPDLPEKDDGIPLDRARGEIALDHVTFAYGSDAPVLRDVSFAVPAGARVGIAGRTGAGKTTLVNVIARLHDATSGAVLLDGVDVRDYKVDDLRDQFAIVLQEPVLFAATIAENIEYGRPGAKAIDVIAAARAANIHEFVSQLPDGYDTLVGERGMRLSGGQRQRIGLARAFLRDAPILVLDEPTSSIDTGTEAGIVEAMKRLMRGRTTFVVAHRLSTLHGCDLLVVLEDGRVHVIDRGVDAVLARAHDGQVALTVSSPT